MEKRKKEQREGGREEGRGRSEGRKTRLRKYSL